MDRCTSCGASLAAGAAWCGQCLTPAAPSAAPATAAGPMTGTPVRFVPAAPAPPAVRTSRWAKTTTTFGPVGRVLGTLLLILPLPVILIGGLADPFILGGAGLWVAVVMPWGLRDLWKAGQLPVR